MKHRTKPECHDGPESEPAATKQWRDEPFVDHHIEETLAALSAVTRLRPPQSPDVSA